MMDQRIYRNYLDDGITGRERLLPVPIAPAPMRRTVWSYIPKVSFPELPTEAMAASARRGGAYALRFIAYSPIFFGVAAVVVVLSLIRIIVGFAMWAAYVAGAILVIAWCVMVALTQGHYTHLAIGAGECVAFLLLATAYNRFSDWFCMWLPKSVEWINL